MRSMETYPRAAMERAMKVQDVMLQMAKKITWWQAHGLVTDSAGASLGTDFRRLRAATGRANGMGLSLL